MFFLFFWSLFVMVVYFLAKKYNDESFTLPDKLFFYLFIMTMCIIGVVARNVLVP